MTILSTKYEYKAIGNLGKGAFGQVVLAEVVKVRGELTDSDRKLEIGTKVAIKCVPYDDRSMSETERTRAANEVRVMRRVSHPHVVQHYDSAIWKNHLYIVMEYIEGSDMAHRIDEYRKQRKYFPEDQVWRWTVQILLALRNMHDKKILHRDLKPANIMLDKANNIKVGDMGLGRIMNADTIVAQTQCGTPLYQAPEIINGVTYDSKVDVWALGVVLYELCYLRAPFMPRSNQGGAAGMMALCRQILDAEPRFPRHMTHVSDNMKYMITMMLNKQPSKRPRLADVLTYAPIRKYLPHVAPDSDQKHVVTSYSDGIHTLEKENTRLKSENDRLKAEMETMRTEAEKMETLLAQWKSFWEQQRRDQKAQAVGAVAGGGGDIYEKSKAYGHRPMPHIHRSPQPASSRKTSVGHMNSVLSENSRHNFRG